MSHRPNKIVLSSVYSGTVPVLSTMHAGSVADHSGLAGCTFDFHSQFVPVLCILLGQTKSFMQSSLSPSHHVFLGRQIITSRLVVPPVKLSTVGSRAFPVAASQTWNSLPEDVTSASTLRSFQQRLKTHLFRQYYSTFSGPRSDMSVSLKL